MRLSYAICIEDILVDTSIRYHRKGSAVVQHIHKRVCRSGGGGGGDLRSYCNCASELTDFALNYQQFTIEHK